MQNNPSMTRHQHRKDRLRELIDAACEGKIVVLADKIARSPSYVSRLLYPEGKDGSRNVGEDIGEAIERAFGLEGAWLDLPLKQRLPGSTSSSRNDSKA